MRTSILMNTGFVIGTGDVSELALGWCTYNGDHMSMYNPNVSIPKTLVKFLVDWAAAATNSTARPGATLLDIVATEISPELLPAGADGQALQATEGDDRPLRAARLLPVPLPALRRAAGEDPVPGRAGRSSTGLHAGRDAPLAAGVRAALLRQPVQALVSAGRAEGRLDQPVAARRLAHAQRRRRRRCGCGGRRPEVEWRTGWGSSEEEEGTMPLLDHFHAPLHPSRPWESFHSRWANSIADELQRLLPPRYVAEVQIHLGSSVEADVAEFEHPQEDGDEARQWLRRACAADLGAAGAAPDDGRQLPRRN